MQDSTLLPINDFGDGIQLFKHSDLDSFVLIIGQTGQRIAINTAFWPDIPSAKSIFGDLLEQDAKTLSRSDIERICDFLESYYQQGDL
ncbi:hypothetical protein [Runella sp.]|uniref:hypothetical protein n=1 Tax=Runella sp. TaxID=1960881 RepID=UPI003D0E3BD4